MTRPWLHIVGIGEAGLNSLNTEALNILYEADAIVGGERHHQLVHALEGEKIVWPSPFSTLKNELAKFRPKTVVVLVTGDPLWYSAGSKLALEWPAEEIQFYPQISAFQLACARMKWSIPDVETLTIHGRPASHIIPYLAPNNKLVLLTTDNTSPSTVAHILNERGYNSSELTVFGAMGSACEVVIQGRAGSWEKTEAANTIPNFHTLCVLCKPQTDHVIISKGPGLPDHVFLNDRNFTKCEVRAITVAALAPFRNKVLWDLGCGSGTVGIEWARLSFEGSVYATEKNQTRYDISCQNAERLGTPRFKVHKGFNKDLINQFPDPDSVFIGGGLDIDLVTQCIDRLKPYGRLVINSVTLESQVLLVNLYKQFGGELIQIAIARVKPVGSFLGWDQHQPVIQWRFGK